MKRFKRLLCGLVLWGIACSVSAVTQESQEIVSEGEAAVGNSRSLAREQAIAQANRLAVEQALGVYVVSETLVQNAAVVKDQILTKASGYVSRYQILSERVQGDVYQIKLRALVSVEPLVEQLARMGLLREWTVAVILVPPDGQAIQDSTEAARVKLNAGILEMGFKVADENALVQLNQPQMMHQIARGNYLAALPVLRDQGVDVLIVGKAFTRPTETGAMETYGGIKTILTEGRIDARALRADTGELMAAQSFNGMAGGSTQAIAEAKAIEQAAAAAGTYFSRQIAKLPAATTQNVQLVVQGLSFAREKLFQESLRQIPGVRKVVRKTYQNQVVQYEIEYAGKTDQCADQLLAFSGLKKFSFEIQSLTSGRIGAKAR